MSNNLASEINKKVDVLAINITPVLAYGLSTSYAEAMVTKDAAAFERFYEALVSGGLSKEDVAYISQDPTKKSLNEAHIMNALSYKAKNPEARGAIKAVCQSVIGILKINKEI